MTPELISISVGVFLLLGIGIGWLLCARVKARKLLEIEGQMEKRTAKLVEKADRDRKAAFLEEKNAWYVLKTKMEREVEDRRREAEKLLQKQHELEENLSEKTEALRRREETVAERERQVASYASDLETREQELREILVEQRVKLERISGLNVDAAREMLLESLREETRRQATGMMKEIIDQVKERAEREAKKIISLAIERCSADQCVQSSISVVPLPDDDIKGRIVGKEGRNIISFEAATGVKVIVNDTPEAVVLSCFDPVKRDIARIAMERLVREGRINPNRVEEVVAEASQKVKEGMLEEGRKAFQQCRIDSLHPDLIQLLGKLKYRMSYGQSVLEHSKEVAFLAGAMAAELKLDEKLARRAGLLHDIGKAMDHEMEGTHVDIGVSLVRRYNEPMEVENAIIAHHEEGEVLSPISFLVTAADRISGARPGARRDDVEGYIKRVKDLEEIARSFDGVDDAYAINAGREVRVMVSSQKKTDAEAAVLAFEIAQRIRSELVYPGEIKVTVIRQTVGIEWAGKPSRKRRSRHHRPEKGDGRHGHQGRPRNDANRKALPAGDQKGNGANVQAHAREKVHYAVPREEVAGSARVSRPPQTDKG